MYLATARCHENKAADKESPGYVLQKWSADKNWDVKMDGHLIQL